jgi:hypothetical protein
LPAVAQPELVWIRQFGTPSQLEKKIDPTILEARASIHGGEIVASDAY